MSLAAQLGDKRKGQYGEQKVGGDLLIADVRSVTLANMAGSHRDGGCQRRGRCTWDGTTTPRPLVSAATASVLAQEAEAVAEAGSDVAHVVEASETKGGSVDGAGGRP